MSVPRDPWLEEEAELERQLAEMEIPDDCKCWGTNAVGHTDADCPHSDCYDGPRT